MRIGTSIFLIALGAILAFAMDIDPTPAAGLTIQWDTVGWILMLVGVLGLIWSAMLLGRARDERPVGYVEETRPVDYVERR